MMEQHLQRRGHRLSDVLVGIPEGARGARQNVLARNARGGQYVRIVGVGGFEFGHVTWASHHP